MNVVLAAVDDSPAARPVLGTALRLARMLDCRVEALHVVERPGGTARAAAGAMGVRLREESGDPQTVVLGELARDDVAAAVIGIRDLPGGAHPTGHLALAVVEEATKPVVVVPPEAWDRDDPRFRSILVPLDGTEASAEAVRPLLSQFCRWGAEVVVVHAFDVRSAPRFLDRPGYDLPSWAGEFLARYCGETGARLHWCRGVVGERVLDTIREEQPDLIVLSWSRDLSPGRAAVVRAVLAHATVPVLLVPAAAEGGEETTVDLTTPEEHPVVARS